MIRLRKSSESYVKCQSNVTSLHGTWRSDDVNHQQKRSVNGEKRREKLHEFLGRSQHVFNSIHPTYDFIGGPFFSECYRAEKEGLLLLIWARKLEAANGCWKIRIIPSVNAPAAVAPAVTVGGALLLLLTRPRRGHYIKESGSNRLRTHKSISLSV